jgi:hypothetical protein
MIQKAIIAGVVVESQFITIQAVSLSIPFKYSKMERLVFMDSVSEVAVRSQFRILFSDFGMSLKKLTTALF